MQIKNLAVSATAFLHLKGPDGAFLYEDSKPVGIDLYGPGSPQAAEVEARQSARAEQNLRENDGKFVLPPLEKRRAHAVEDLVTLTAGFRHIEHEGLTGAVLFKAVYSDPELGWIRPQAEGFAVAWGKFVPGSSGN